jgi:hypothetical protein
MHDSSKRRLRGLGGLSGTTLNALRVKILDNLLNKRRVSGPSPRMITSTGFGRYFISWGVPAERFSCRNGSFPGLYDAM